MGRFKSLAKKFQSNPELFQKYKTIINEQEELGIIEKISDIGATHLRYWPCHYVPQHPVITPSKATTKVRIVYDASAKASKAAPSLNDCLYRGPIILEDLCGLLLRFRLHRIAIVADIEKAFLQVGLQGPDRDVTRVLWFQDDTDPKVDNNVQVYRFCRVPFGVISSSFLLGATLKHHLATEGERTSPETANKILSGLYVDNVVTGVDSTDKATEFYCQAKTIFQQASMNLREWNSNDQAFLQHIADVDRAETKKQKVMGLAWDIQQDLLSITSIVTEDSAQATTKRQVLKRTASIYNPLGLFAPITLKAKLLLQNVCDQGLDWDASLEADDLATWSKICEDLDRIPTCQIPRVVGNLSDNPNQAQQNQLVCFCDASTLAYAAIVYLRIETATSVQINLVFAKTTLSPPNRMTIPRLELMAALIAVRCLSFIESQMKLPFTAKYVWTDSTVQLRPWLIEVEAVINSRPLTAISHSPDDREVLTPRHFLSFNPQLVSIPSKSTNPTTERTSDNLLESWKRGKHHLEQFWKIWSTDYIAALRERSDYKHQQSIGKVTLPPCINDVVLIKEEFQPRGKWRMGRISDVYPGSDGCVRIVKLQLQDGKFLIRPTKLLYPLKLNHQVTSTNNEETTSHDVGEEGTQECSSTHPESPNLNFLRVLQPKPADIPVQLDPDRNSEPSENSPLNSDGTSQRLPRETKLRAKAGLKAMTNTSRLGVSRTQ